MSDSGNRDGNRRNIIIGAAVVILILILLALLRGCYPRATTTSADANHTALTGAMLNLGDAVMTGFSGTVVPSADKLPAGLHPIDKTFIDTSAASARIFNPRKPGFVWDGRYWAAPRTHDIPASAVGQVFGIALDNQEYPDIYLTATSLYGLNIVVPPPLVGADGKPTNEGPRRTKTGRSDASWMAGQFGYGGGPGSIWKVDGRNGRITHFADVTLNGETSGPASLGSIAFDAAHQELFVSDLSTGMISRFDLSGRLLERFDHGVTARRAAHLAPVAYDPKTRADIRNTRFNSETPATWGFAPQARRVFGLAVHGGRLYYAVSDGKIWSVGLGKNGEFTADTRWEIDVPGSASAPPVSTIVFMHDGTMIVAQRAIAGTTYDYKALPASGTAHVYRFQRENPKNPNTPSEWYQQPEEYAVGFAGDNHSTAGGVALGYGYNSDGAIDFTGCEDALFFTGDMLRDFHQLDRSFAPKGPLELYGLQVSPSRSVRGFNTPPTISYFVNYTDRMSSADASGTIGDVVVYRVDCKEPGCKLPPEGRPLGALPPTSTRLAGIPPGVVAPPPGSPPGVTPAECAPGSPGCSAPCVVGSVGCSPPCVPGAPGCSSPCIPGMPGCVSPCLTPDCCIGDGCNHTSGKMCMEVEGTATCDPATGKWIVQVAMTDQAGIGIDTLTVHSATTGVSLSNGPDISLPSPPGEIDLTGAAPGQMVSLQVCGFKNSDRMGGQPYDCCRQVLRVRIPRTVCTATSTQGGH